MTDAGGATDHHVTRQPAGLGAVRAVDRSHDVKALAGAVAHELNNLLTAVIGYGTLLADQVAEDADASASAQQVLSGAEGIATLARQLLRFGARQVLVPQPVDVATVLDSVDHRVRMQFGGSVRLGHSVVADMPELHLDPDEFEEALFDVVSTAVGATPEGGRVDIVVSRVAAEPKTQAEAAPRHVADWTRIAVSDPGPAVEGEERERFFEPFFVPSGRKARRGLGLASAAAFVQGSGGSIRVESAARDAAGLTVAMYFPSQQS